MNKKKYRVTSEIADKAWLMIQEIVQTVNSRRCGTFARESVMLSGFAFTPKDGFWIVEVSFSKSSKWKKFRDFKDGRVYKFHVRNTSDHSKLMRLLGKYGKSVSPRTDESVKSQSG